MLTRLLGATLGLTFVLALAFSQPASADGVGRTYPLTGQPRTIAIDPTDGRMFVANLASSQGFLTVIDPASGQVTDHPTSGAPNVLALDPVHHRLYVAYFNQTLDVFDTTTMSLMATLPVYAVGLAVDTTNQRVYAAGATVLTVIDGTTNTVLTTRPALENENWFSVAVDPSLHRVYVTNFFYWPEFNVHPSLIVLDDRDLSIITELLLPVRPRMGLAVDQARHVVYVAGGGTSANNGFLPQLVAYDGASLAELGRATVPGDPTGIAFGADRIYVTSSPEGYTAVDANTFDVVQSVWTLPVQPFLPAVDLAGTLYLGVFHDSISRHAVIAIEAGNHAPIITLATFSPAAPTTNDALSFRVLAMDGDFANLPDGQRDPVTLTYEWTRNGSPISTTGSVIELSVPGAGDRGDAFTARVTVTDPEGLTTSASASVVIANAVPRATLSLSSTAPDADDVLTVSVTASDEDGDVVTLAYEWLRNGVVIPGETTASLDLAAHSELAATTVTIRLTASDGNGGVRVVTASALVVPTTGSFLYMKSQPGDYIGAGAEWLYARPDTTVWASLAQGGRFFNARFLQGTAHTWSVDMVAPQGQPLVIGSYPGAIRAAVSSTTPGLQVSGEGRGCNTLTGRFDVTQLSFSPTGVLLLFEATFEQHCEGAAPALFGHVRYEDDMTPGVTLPAGAIPVPTSGQFVYVNNARGSEVLFSAADSTFGPWEKLFEGGNVFRVVAVKGNNVRTASVQMGAAPGQPLAVGQYVRAVRGVPPAGTPHLDASLDSSGCSQTIGKFDVEELSFAPTGELTLLQATFEQRCVNTINVLFGRVRIENPYRPGVTLPAGTITVPTAGNFLYFKSDAGDSIGLGAEQLYTSADATFTRSSADVRDLFSLSVVQGNVHNWNVNLAPPAGQPLAVGSYVRAFRAPFRPAGSPGIDIYGDGRGCNTILGKFDVDELTFWSNGDLRAFQATFEQHCENRQPALFGRVRFETLPPVPLSVAISADGTIPSKTISATISGTVTCSSRDALVQIRGTLTQTQGRVVVTGTVAIDVDCVAPTVTWSVGVSPDSGKFKSGSAVAAVNAVVCEPGCTSAAATATVKLSPGK
jgi:DNA-binding beta-propeller fold protein YncE